MTIIWSPEILEDIDNLAQYLHAKWPTYVWENFKHTLFKRIDLISAGILGGRPAVKDAAVLSISITEHNRLYYEVKDHTLLLLRLWDTRQNPTRHPFE